MNYPTTLPASHRPVLEHIVEVLSQDSRIMGIGLSGSYAANSMDQYSDLDFVIAVDPEHYPQVIAQRFDILQQFSGLLAAFTGEHVGEPRLIVSLFEQTEFQQTECPHTELVHVDFKFVALPDAAQRVDNTQVIWQQDSALSDVFATQAPHYPQPNPQWIEDRFWIWVHYGASKIARGEYFETVEFLSFLRFHVLSPLALKQAGLTPSGVRNIEKRLPEFAQQLVLTVAMPQAQPLTAALKQVVRLYLELRQHEQVEVNEVVQQAAENYLQQIGKL